MKYVFLAYTDKQQWDAMPISERDALEHACHVSEEDLHQSGHLFAVDDTQSGNNAITIRIDNGMLSLNDGSLAETHRPPVRLLFITARDLNDAIQIASKMRLARSGFIEIRSIKEFDRSSPM